jgi:hypothetical protein
MFNTKTFLRQCAFAAVLASSAIAAMAAPTYHVSINTAGNSGVGGVDFLLSSNGEPLTATLSNFSGAFGAADLAGSTNASAGPDGSFALVDPIGYLFRLANLGGTLAFDVSFSGSFFDTPSGLDSVFSSALYAEDGTVIGNAYGFAIFDLIDSAPTVVNVTTDPFATVTPVLASAVPEPSSMLMMMTGLGLAGFMARRRKSAR